MRALLEAGKRVPEDVSVVGFDDARYASASPVPLSTIRVPRKEIGRAVAQWVVDLKRNPAAHPGSMLLAAEWVERASTGPAAHG
jgi:DNA-binding LacI/PurR family transcriptional regulator